MQCRLSKRKKNQNSNNLQFFRQCSLIDIESRWLGPKLRCFHRSGIHIALRFFGNLLCLWELFFFYNSLLVYNLFTSSDNWLVHDLALNAFCNLAWLMTKLKKKHTHFNECFKPKPSEKFTQICWPHKILDGDFRFISTMPFFLCLWYILIRINRVFKNSQRYRSFYKNIPSTRHVTRIISRFSFGPPDNQQNLYVGSL